MRHQNSYIVEIKIPHNVEIQKQKNMVLFSGPLGSTGINLEKIDPFGVCALVVDQKNLRMTLLTSSKAYSGLLKKLIHNKIEGITRGFLLYLKIVGIGYRAALEKNTLFFKLGYSHDILYNIPPGLKIFLLDPTLLCLFGIEKNQLTQVASQLRGLRKPSVYKGKGIRFVHEIVRTKTGKRK